MKTSIKIALFFLLLTAALFIYAQEATTASGKIASAIKAGNARDLAAYFHPNIELIVLENDGTYSKSQAEIILRDFFSKKPPRDFSINHNGSSKDNSSFFIGSYKTTGQETYRVYFLMKNISGSTLIQQLQIQE